MRPYSSNDSSHFHDPVPTRISQDIVTLCDSMSYSDHMSLLKYICRPFSSRPKPQFQSEAFYSHANETPFHA